MTVATSFFEKKLSNNVPTFWEQAH